MQTFADSNHWKRWRLTRLPPIEMSLRKYHGSALCCPDSTMRRKWKQVKHRSHRWLAVFPRRDLERLQRCFINLYPQLHFVLESAKPRMPIEFINKFFTLNT